LNIRDLQYLVAVHDLNNFSKAAERCFVSQPTLSGQLKKLEEELGSPLMERSTRQVLFTDLGEKVVQQARGVLLSIEHMRELARQSDDIMSGDLHIGLIPTVGPFLLPIIMPALGEKFPKLNLFLYELQTDRLIEKLLKGELDAAVLAKLDWDHPVRELALYSESMNLAVSDQDPLAGSSKPVEKSVLHDRAVLMLEDGHCLRDQALGVCFAAGAIEDQRFQATSMDTLLHMVATGAGITLTPDLACRQSTAGVRFLPFADPKPMREIVMLHRNKSARSKALENVAKVIASSVAAI
jgi:LysR family hydrogen peroxide-inducible transcriptional activator